MGFVIQMAPGKKEGALVPGVLVSSDNAAGGHLGAKTAAVVRGTRPGSGTARRPGPVADDRCMEVRSRVSHPPILSNDCVLQEGAR